VADRYMWVPMTLSGP